MIAVDPEEAATTQKTDSGIGEWRVKQGMGGTAVESVSVTTRIQAEAFYGPT